ncbi:MAG TPA: 4Fe-4S binding protein [Bacillota bacterium]|nr:4Fe-4S binding protein [Bacillota bacterium]
MKSTTKEKLTRNLLITQISIYAFIVLHAILWYVFGVHYLTKLCPFVFAEQVGNLELNLAILFWVLVFISTLFLGRAFCAWGCMFGAYQDFVARIVKILRIKPTQNKLVKWLVWFIIFLVLIGYLMTNKSYWPSLYWFIAGIILVGWVIWLFLEKKKPAVRNLQTLPKYILLAQYLGGIIALWITLNVFHKGFTFVFDKYSVFYDEKWIIQIAFAAVIAFAIGTGEKRIFCKYLCPIGMLLRLFSAIPFPKKYKVRAAGEKCTKCGKCNKECFMGINPMEEINQHGYVKDPNCINCLVCVSKCPKKVLDFTTAQKNIDQPTYFQESKRV